MDLTRGDVARLLLDQTPIDRLRLEARRNRQWSVLFRGFRPNSLTRGLFLQRGTQFAADIRLLSQLCVVYLDTLEVSPSHSLLARFEAAADLGGLSDDGRTVCMALSKIALEDLPAGPLFRDSTLHTQPDRTTVELDTSAGDGVQRQDDDSIGYQDHSPIAKGPSPISSVGSQNAGNNPPSHDDVVDISPETNERIATTGSESDPPSQYISERVLLDWQPPEDHVTEAQQAVTLFERSLAAFVERQLKALHGKAWLRRGCNQAMRDRWSEKASKNAALSPRSDLGYAEIGELQEIIVRKDNWSAFSSYFDKQQSVSQDFKSIIALRISAMHPAQRDLRLVPQIEALGSMVRLAQAFDPPTADRIDDLFQQTLSPSSGPDPLPEEAGGYILSNISDFPDPQLVGRDTEIAHLWRLWDDSYTTTISVVGAGGVGKTALLDAFTHMLLSRPLGANRRPDPEVIIYLTAKDNYLQDMRRPPPSRQFKTLHRLYEVTLETCIGTSDVTVDLDVMRRDVLSLAESMRILFALDNLESLDDIEYEQIAAFISDLPRPSKAILTTRVNRRLGSGKVQLDGLPPTDARRLLLDRLATHDIVLDSSEESAIDDIVSYTDGFPLTIVYAANAIVMGNSPKGTLDSIKGQKFLQFLHFSFESSMLQLSSIDVQILLYLSLSTYPRSLNNMSTFATDNDSLSDALKNLLDMSFIRRSVEEKRRVRFLVDNPQLRDYVKKRAPEMIAPDQYAQILRHARVLPADAESPSVSIEIDRALERARDAASRDWLGAITVLESARTSWGEDPRLLAVLGYYYFRVEQRETARELMEKAISLGYESADNYAYLALVLFYERKYEQALRRCEISLTLRSPFPFAEQIAGQCLMNMAVTNALMTPISQRIQLLERSLAHLKRSVIVSQVTRRDEDHNRRSDSLISRVEQQISQVRSSAAVAHR